MDKDYFQKFLEANIPSVSKMGYKLEHLSDEKAVAIAPLSENSNHKGSAFGGGLYNCLVLSSYSWLYHWLESRNHSTSIVIQSASIQYLREARDPQIEGICDAPPPDILQRFESQLSQKKKARILLEAKILSADNQCLARMEGKFVVFEKS